MASSVRPFEGPPSEWDGFARRQEGWTNFHLHGWREIMDDVFGHECLYLCARGGGEDGPLEGVLPLVRVKSPLFGHYLVSMPFLNHGGPLGSSGAVAALCRAAADRAAADGADLLELRSRRELPVELRVSHRKVAVLLDLPDDPGTLHEALRSKVRNQVRRPRKEGVRVRFGPEEVGPFYDVFARHMRDLGTPVLPAALFEALPVTFGDDVWFGCAYLDDRPIACGAGFRWADEFEITWASALRDYSRVAANMLLYWSFMERSIQEGVGTFNFGRCTPGGGTHRFKLQWGGRDEELWWYQAPRDGRTATPSPDDGAYGWGPRLWRRLPLPVANALGPRIVRCIP